jgi:hypothetical protein
MSEIGDNSQGRPGWGRHQQGPVAGLEEKLKAHDLQQIPCLDL